MHGCSVNTAGLTASAPLTDLEICQAIRAVRRKNRAVYAEMASYVDAESVGFRMPKPDDPDVTMDLLELALSVDPARTKALLRNGIYTHDRHVNLLTGDLAR